MQELLGFYVKYQDRELIFLNIAQLSTEVMYYNFVILTFIDC